MKYFYFRKSHNGNSLTYKLPLDQVKELHERAYNGKTVLYGLLKAESQDQFYSKQDERFYNQLQKRDIAIQHDRWSALSDYVYSFTQHDARNLISWIELYETAILPNYEPKDYHQLETARYTVSNALGKITTVYEYLDRQIAEERDNNYDITRAGRIKEAATFAIRLILNDFPSKHIEYAIDQAQSERLPINYRSATVRLTGTEHDHTINKITKELLERATATHNYSFSSGLLEALDCYNPRYFDALYTHITGKVAPTHNGHHRDIVHQLDKQ